MADNSVIGFAGLTHLGLNSALAAAANGFDVIGWDADAALIEALARGEIPIEEPGFNDLFEDVKGRFQFSSDKAALLKCDVTFLSVDVPTDGDGKSDLSPLESLLGELSPHIRQDAIFVILSQVPPGFTARFTELFGNLYYQVETLVFGRAVERARYPERFIVGTPDPAAALPPAYAKFLASFDCPILPMLYESAELCKIAINCFLVASVSTTNALASLCEKIGANWGEIAPALRLDARIGPHAYLNPGLGISGGNLERDLRNVVEMSQDNGVDAGPIQEYRRFSGISKDWALQVLRDELGAALPDREIAVLGLAYKENTHSTKNSPALRLIGNLAGSQIKVYDPIVPASAAPGTTGADSMLACLEGCDALCIMTPWEAFKSLTAADIKSRLSGTVVVDPYGLIDGAAMRQAGLRHHVRGRRTN